MADALDGWVTELADRYRIDRTADGTLRLLGEGGMASVYAAVDLKHQRPVAIKLLRPNVAAAMGAERFLQEIRVTANLQHPHILALLDSGVVTVDAGAGATQSVPYYVMPLVDGESLRDRLTREVQLPVETAIAIAKAVASALDYAHRHGVIHRDIKPENILLHEGEPLVADFGIALAASAAGGSRLTDIGFAVGTPQYMSPEQSAGQRDVGVRTDVYALGCVVYEMLAGEPPFTGPTAQAIAAKAAFETPRSLRAGRPSVPAHIDAAVGKALAKLPADRFDTPGAFVTAMEAVESSAPAIPIAGSRTRKRAWVLGVGAAAATVLLIGALWMVRRNKAAVTSGGTPRFRVLVMPFENRTGDSTLTTLGDMTADRIAADLSRDVREWAEVVPMATVREFLGREAPTGPTSARLAAATNAEWLVAGVYFKRGDSLEFQAELKDVKNGRLIRALDPISGIATSTAAIQTVAAHTAIAVYFAGMTRSTSQNFEGYSLPSNIEAMREQWRAVDVFAKGDNRAAAEHSRRAAKLDPDWFLPVAYLMGEYSNQGDQSVPDSLLKEWIRRRDRLRPFDQALLDYFAGEEDQELQYRAATEVFRAASNWQVMLVMMADQTNRVREAIRIIELDVPDSLTGRSRWPPWANYETWPYHVLGDHEAELKVAERYRRNLPASPWMRELLGSAMAAAGRIADLPTAMDSALALPPDGVRPRVGLVPAVVGLELIAHGHQPLARALFDKALAWYQTRIADSVASAPIRFEYAQVLTWAGQNRLANQITRELTVVAPDSADYWGLLGVTAARLEDPAQVAVAEQRLVDIRIPHLDNLHTWWRASIAAVQGKCDRAVELLRASLLHGQVYNLDLHRLPYFAPIRDCPAFKQILEPRG